MEAAAEGAVGLSEAGDGSPLSGAAASDDGDTVVGVSYGMDAADMGTSSPLNTDESRHYQMLYFVTPTYISIRRYRKSRLISASKESVG